MCEIQTNEQYSAKNVFMNMSTARTGIGSAGKPQLPTPPALLSLSLQPCL